MATDDNTQKCELEMGYQTTVVSSNFLFFIYNVMVHELLIKAMFTIFAMRKHRRLSCRLILLEVAASTIIFAQVCLLREQRRH